MIKKIAIQGIKGAFHHQVALEYFGNNIEIDECLSFEELSDSLLEGRSDLAVMALENSIAGSIIPNYALIDKNDFQIIGEYYLEIQQNLMALSGQQISDIQEVHSHPMALLQCMEFLKKHPHIKLVEDKDTAETARRIQQNQLKGIAAIASKVASEMYNLDIIAPEIQTINNNMTRFVIISKKTFAIDEKTTNKASVKFELDHKRGSLAAVLNVMSDCKLNLTKIQSLPKIETPWKYAFFVDVTFETYQDYAKAKSLVAIMASYFKVLGEFKNNKIK
ncbi:prephenate dehydratase [Flavobacterium branchiophilum]|uniref:prephenate dehydratase n=2 Tax=Flavobacterium branchiophilum TaxID=55197 RepID=G2Z4S8_FLABF|nr:prephenate dehydratase [Flavobacterium branchiophilum]OXA75270.1 prephenate dehydratase [Flavobacterium branchiophilum] [Flavobacterium branchiophilum NBRC 15030 = ATCC 35035]PDS22791.1 prephenate dehydratase [Flavobacterium branchiophilum]TQM39973.1 prephenate dehydratase [Flavobacterium branchiophilum]CCB70640.1 Prephenate dehydratase [Flavobacterium branchiophilum FL-15]GEM54586.1 prephenate dehydratase [Flavobacterium branchiophilum NBRC 15030 = ATCC 35035]